MKKTLAILMTALFPIVVLAASAGGSSYGDGVTIAEPVAIPTLLSDPDSYVGQTVRVDGVITGVCKKRGCWMQLTDPETGQGVRIKVDDGVIVFPYESMGHKAAAQGIFEAVKLTPEQVAARTAAAGEGAQHAHGPDEPCEKGTGPKTGCDAPVHNDTIYVLRGTGAVIES